MQMTAVFSQGLNEIPGSSTTVCCWRTGCVGHLFWGQIKSLGWGVYFQILTGEGHIKARLCKIVMTSKIDSLMVSFLIINDKNTLLALAPKFGAIVQGGIYIMLRSWTDMVPGTASTLFFGFAGTRCLQQSRYVTSATIGIGINVGSMCTRFAIARNGLNSRNNEPWTHVWDSGAFCFRIVIQTIQKQVYSILHCIGFCCSWRWQVVKLVHKIQDVFCPILDTCLSNLHRVAKLFVHEGAGFSHLPRGARSTIYSHRGFELTESWWRTNPKVSSWLNPVNANSPQK